MEPKEVTLQDIIFQIEKTAEMLLELSRRMKQGYDPGLPQKIPKPPQPRKYKGEEEQLQSMMAAHAKSELRKINKWIKEGRFKSIHEVKTWFQPEDWTPTRVDELRKIIRGVIRNRLKDEKDQKKENFNKRNSNI